eukprot:4148969-Amphidinium_carterae.2
MLCELAILPNPCEFVAECNIQSLLLCDALRDCMPTLPCYGCGLRLQKVSLSTPRAAEANER